MTLNSPKSRCRWVEGGNALYYQYHDKEWGVPVHDDRTHFEFILLEGAQAGLSWATILNKRENYRRAFADFSAEAVAGFTAADRARLLADSGIVRNRLKIDAAIGNARAFLAVQDAHGSFDNFIWRFVDGKQRHKPRNASTPAETAESLRISKELKKLRFKFVGATIMYSYMQAVGLVNDHDGNCFRYDEIAAGTS